MSTNYWSHQLSKFLCTEQATDICWEKSCDWSVAVGVSAFREELSAEARVGDGTVARVKKPPQSFPEESRSIARERGCLTCSSVRRSDWCVSCFCKWLVSCLQKRRARVGDLGIYLFIWQTTQRITANQSRSSLADYSYAVACHILQAGKQQAIKVTRQGKQRAYGCVCLGALN